IFFRNSDTIISHLNLNELTGRLDTVSLDGSTQKRHLPSACHRLNGVQNEVHKYLLHLLSVNPRLRQVSAKLAGNLDALFLRLSFENAGDIIDHIVDIFRRHIGFGWPCKGQEVGYETANPVNFLEREPLESLAEFRVVVTFGQKL